ncbi:MAG: hypothetical protein Q9163_004901 [Psora crenata]
MGRYDFRPLRVHQTATQLLQTERIASPPPWYTAVGNIPPAEPLVRTQPLQHQQRRRQPKTKKASKLFMPQKVTYEEDRLRKEFFKDHPWELARPRMVIEDDGRDSYKTDYKQIRQPDKALNGESVIQRQIWLQQNVPGISKAGAYDRARKEFYDLRLQEDTERRVAKEEALHTGAHFGPSAMEIGIRLEDQEYERWKIWAQKQVEVLQQRQAAMYTGSDTGEIADAEPVEEMAALERIPGSTPAQG